MKTVPSRWLRNAAFAAWVALLALPVLWGLGLLDLLARVNETEEWVFRAGALILLVAAASGLWFLQWRRPDLDDTLARLVVAGLCGATVLGGLGQFSWWLELFAHFPFQYAAGLSAGALYFAARRNAGVAACAAAMAAANLYVLSPQLFSWPALAADRGETVRLAAANLHKENRDAESVLRFVQWSWPAGFWPLAIPIDHCLTSPGVRIASRRLGPYIGSDHYPLVVDLAAHF